MLPGIRKRDACGLLSGEVAFSLPQEVRQDELLPDVLVFPPATDLHDHPLVKTGGLVLQASSQPLFWHFLLLTDAAVLLLEDMESPSFDTTRLRLGGCAYGVLLPRSQKRPACPLTRLPQRRAGPSPTPAQLQATKQPTWQVTPAAYPLICRSNDCVGHAQVVDGSGPPLSMPLCFKKQPVGAASDSTCGRALRTAARRNLRAPLRSRHPRTSHLLFPTRLWSVQP